MEDVIFAGNEKRKPLGLAEVTITFDNSDKRLPIDFEEVEIARRAYRAGEIEYYINRNQVRLRDVLDLLMGTGLGPGSYSIVSQGQIDAILTSKPVDRRALFEETAGIAKFLARKNESLRRLEQTEQNAIRINDLIVELERRLPELDTQVRRAKRYRKLNARVRDLEILSYIRASVAPRPNANGSKANSTRTKSCAARARQKPRRSAPSSRRRAPTPTARNWRWKICAPKRRRCARTFRGLKPSTPPRRREAKRFKRKIRRHRKTRIAFAKSAKGSKHRWRAWMRV